MKVTILVTNEETETTYTSKKFVSESSLNLYLDPTSHRKAMIRGTAEEMIKSLQEREYGKK